MNISTIQLFVFIVLVSTIYSFAQQKSFAEAKLVADSFSPEKDSIISIGVLINLKDDWHIYWRNPGDSGLPTEIDFTLPEGFKVSEIKFPIPNIFFSDEIVNYGYSHQVLLMSELFIPKNYSKKEVFINAKLTSLICKDLCKSFDTTITLELDLSQDFHPTKHISDIFDYTRSVLPVINHNIKVLASRNSNSISLWIDKKILSETEISSFEFYNYEAGVFKNFAKQTNNDLGKYLELVLEPDPFRVEDPKELQGIILLNNDHSKVYEINIPIKD